MPQFRKKPVVIQAEQWFPDRIVKGVRWEQESRDDGEFLKPYVITAHEQRAYLAPGDWIIPEPKPNRFYPCKPDIFAATYDTIEAAYDDIRELRELSEKCPLPLKVEGECLIVLDSDRRRFTDLGTPEMAQFVLASVNYVRSILPYPAAPVLHDEKDLASYWKAAHDRVVAQNWELSRQIDALQKVGEQCLRPQQTTMREAAEGETRDARYKADCAEEDECDALGRAEEAESKLTTLRAELAQAKTQVAGMRRAFFKVAMIQARELQRMEPAGTTPPDLDAAMAELRRTLTNPEPPHGD